MNNINYKKYKVQQKFYKQNNIFEFTFDKIVSDIRIKLDNWNYIQLLFNNISRSIITNEQYLLFFNTNLNEINISEIFTDILPPNTTIKIKMNYNEKIILEYIVNQTHLDNQLKLNTYRTQYFNITTDKEQILIDKNIPFSDIYISFNDNFDNFDFITINENDDKLIKRISINDEIDLIPKKINDIIYWYNTCIDKIEENYFYPNNCYLYFYTLYQNKLDGRINYNIPNIIFLNNFKLYYSLSNINIEKLSNYPLTQIGPNKYVEGLWFNPNYDSELDILYPYPKKESNIDLDFYKKLEELSKFFKINEYNNQEVFEFEFNNNIFIFPKTYLLDKNVNPSHEFRSAIENLYNNFNKKINLFINFPIKLKRFS